MKAKCIVDCMYFTKGQVYDVTHIDDEGDVWVVADDDGHALFLYPDECEVFE